MGLSVSPTKRSRKNKADSDKFFYISLRYAVAKSKKSSRIELTVFSFGKNNSGAEGERQLARTAYSDNASQRRGGKPHKEERKYGIMMKLLLIFIESCWLIIVLSLRRIMVTTSSQWSGYSSQWGDTESVIVLLLICYINYNNIVNVLNAAANACVPRHKKNFYKYWWDEEMNLLKDESIESDKLWKAACKPRHGPIFDHRQKCKSIYRKRIRECEKSRFTSYTNDLHECLLKRMVPPFGNAGTPNSNLETFFGASVRFPIRLLWPYL